MKTNQAASQQMIFVAASFNLKTLSIEHFSMNVVYKQYFIEEVTFQEPETKHWCFFYLDNENSK